MARPDRPAKPERPGAARLWQIIAGIALLLAILFAWLLWPREDKLADVAALQKQVLAAVGSPSSRDIEQVMRTIDRMDRREVWAAYRAAGKEWKRLKQETIDDYFAADEAARQQVLDQYLDRLDAYHRLLQAMNPQGRPDSPAFLPRERRRRGQPEEPAAEKTAEEKKAEAARQSVEKRFDERVESRARERRRPLPAFR